MMNITSRKLDYFSWVGRILVVRRGGPKGELEQDSTIGVGSDVSIPLTSLMAVFT